MNFADARSAIVDHVAAFAPPGGTPAWHRYFEPAVFLRAPARSPIDGGWQLALGLPESQSPVKKLGDGSRGRLVRCACDVVVSRKLSPGAERNDEEQDVAAYYDALRVHVFGAAAGPNAAQVALTHGDADTVEAGADGWLWLTVRGYALFYLTLSS
jgi:hypothetical protein